MENVEDSPPPRTKPASTKSKPKSTQVKPPNNAGKDTGSDSEAGPSGVGSRDVVNTGKAAQTKKVTSKATDSDIEEVAPQPRAKPKAKTKVASPPEGDPDIEEPPKKGKGKGKAKAISPDEEVLIIEPEEPPPKTRTKRKTPPDAGNSDVEVLANRPAASKARGTAAAKPASVARDTATKPKRGRPPSRANSVHPAQGEEEEATDTEKDVAPKKKRRKINIFPTNNAEPPGFNFMPQVWLSLRSCNRGFILASFAGRYWFKYPNGSISSERIRGYSKPLNVRKCDWKHWEYVDQ